jgi:hypothetical protein
MRNAEVGKKYEAERLGSREVSKRFFHSLPAVGILGPLI